MFQRSLHCLPKPWQTAVKMSKKMKLISDKEYEALISHSKYSSPENSDLQQKEESGSLVLQQNLPDDIKLALYMQISKTFADKFNEIINKPIRVEVVNKPSNPESKSFTIPAAEETLEADNTDDDDLLIKMPLKMRDSAKIVLDTLRHHPNLVVWNRNGTIVDFLGTEEPGANMVDLLSYLLRDQKWTTAPIGTNRFLLICKQAKIPASLVRTGLRANFQGTLSEFKTAKSTSDSVLEVDDIKKRLDNLRNWSTLDPVEGEPRTSTPKSRKSMGEYSFRFEEN